MVCVSLTYLSTQQTTHHNITPDSLTSTHYTRKTPCATVHKLTLLIAGSLKVVKTQPEVYTKR